MSEPDIIAQNGDLLDPTTQMQWFMDRADEAHRAGAVLCRASVHPDIPGLILFEAWNEWPKDQGDPRWQLVKHG